jgi:acetylornithine aminotransferase/acetylornithine/N-succinyldiaminopimelate aminotransferase
MGAMLCTEDAANAITPGMHGTTFGGGPLACAVAIAVIDTIRNTNLLEHVRETGDYFKTRLQSLSEAHASIKEVRGMGLMLGVELDSAELAEDVAAQMMNRKIIINRTSENVLRFLPPYILQREHVDITIATLDELLKLKAASSGLSLVGEKDNG